MGLKLWQTCHKIAEKSSEIVPLGAPFLRRRTAESTLNDPSLYLRVLTGWKPKFESAVALSLPLAVDFK